MASGATFAEQIGGLAASSYDQVAAGGNVELGGATLSLSLLNGFAPSAGSTYDILHLTGGTLSGEFAQGDAVTVDSCTFAISYTSTDVVLSYAAPAPPPPAPGPSAGSSILSGGSDIYRAGNGGEMIYGEGGSDRIIGGIGGDTISAGDYTGSHVGSPSDLTVLQGGGDADSVIGGHGHDQLFGQMGNDHLTVPFGGQGSSVYAGQGDDVIDAAASNAANYLSGDIGLDTITTGTSSDTVLGGQGDDVIVGGTHAGAGFLQLLFGNMGHDVISYAGAGSVEIYGGKDDDTLSIATSGQGRTHYLFGNLGDDTLTASGGYNGLYGGQGNDIVSAAGDPLGHNYLSGDLGDDTITSSFAGSDTVHGGPGADTITITAHASSAGDVVLVDAGDSTASSTADERNLDHIVGFDFASDRIVVTGHTDIEANVTVYLDNVTNNSEKAAFASAYLYACGDGTTAHVTHTGATGYLAVVESYDETSEVYVFTSDHTALAITGATAASFRAGAIVGD